MRRQRGRRRQQGGGGAAAESGRRADSGGDAAPARSSATAGAVRRGDEIGQPDDIGVVVVLGRMARWELRFKGGGIYTRIIGSSLCHQPVPKGCIGTGWSHQPVPKGL